MISWIHNAPSLHPPLTCDQSFWHQWALHTVATTEPLLRKANQSRRSCNYLIVSHNLNRRGIRLLLMIFKALLSLYQPDPRVLHVHYAWPCIDRLARGKQTLVQHISCPLPLLDWQAVYTWLIGSGMCRVFRVLGFLQWLSIRQPILSFRCLECQLPSRSCFISSKCLIQLSANRGSG